MQEDCGEVEEAMKFTQDEIQNYYWKQHFSLKEIAQIYDIDQQTVRYWMKKWNIKRRTKSEGCLERYKRYAHPAKGRKLTARQKNAFVNAAKKWRQENPELQRGENAVNWHGGRSINFFGYIEVHAPNHPHCNSRKRMLEHRLIAEKALGRYLRKKKDVVHHINGIKTDNRRENLLICSESYHRWLHNTGRILKESSPPLCNLTIQGGGECGEPCEVEVKAGRQEEGKGE